jgi:hypothetical protein
LYITRIQGIKRVGALIFPIFCLILGLGSQWIGLGQFGLGSRFEICTFVALLLGVSVLNTVLGIAVLGLNLGLIIISFGRGLPISLFNFLGLIEVVHLDSYVVTIFIIIFTSMLGSLEFVMQQFGLSLPEQA